MKWSSNLVVAALMALGATLLVALALLPRFTLFSAVEDSLGDQLMKLEYHWHAAYASKPIHPDLVFVDINEASVQALGRWPFPRSVHGQFLDVLAPEKPRVVAWDILFTENSQEQPSAAPTAPPDASGTPPPLPKSDDELFADSAGKFPNLITGAKRENSAPPLSNADFSLTRPLTHVTGDTSRVLSASSAILPYPQLRKNSVFGFVDEESGNSGVRRSMPMLVKVGDQCFPSFDLQTVLRYWQIDPDKVEVDLSSEVRLPLPDGTVEHIPIDKHGYMLISYRARLDDFTEQHQAMSYASLATGLAVKEGLVDKPTDLQLKWKDQLPGLKDKIVVVGVNIAGTDASGTPLDNVTPLVTTHLNIINNILQKDFLQPVSPLVWLPVYFLFIFLTAFLLLRVGVLPMISITILAIVLIAVIGFGLLWFANLQAPVAYPELGLLLVIGAVASQRFSGEEKEKRRVRAAMSAYLSEKVMNKVLAHPDNVKLGGVKQEITVMFCDIRGFTKYCDDRDPQEVLNVVNEYFEEMTKVVFKYDGTVDKYIGDCIMAFWNAPEFQADHAQRAVCCAMEMRYALANFKTRRAGKDTELFECGIGIHTGEALVGNMGSSLKLNYTAMGSTVNLAARLESLTKRLNERILISHAVLEQLQGDFPLTDRGEAMVPGFAQPVHVYAVGADQDITSALKVGRVIARQQDYTAEEVTEPIWEPVPVPQEEESVPPPDEEPQAEAEPPQQH